MADIRLPEGPVQGGFVVYNDANSPVVGLLSSDFEVLLSKDGVNNGAAVTLSEVGSGRYHYSFTADPGEWFLLIRHAPENARGWSENIVTVSISVGTGGGGAPKKYRGPQRTNMRNAFMLDELRKKAAEVDRVERQKLVAIMALLAEEEYP
jgi:hypothetical protein